jgi:hypothetical protein
MNGETYHYRIKGKDKNGNELVSGVYFYTLSSNQGEKHGFITIIK